MIFIDEMYGPCSMCTIVHVPLTISAEMNFLFFWITFNKSTKVYHSLVIIMDFLKQGNEIKSA